MASPDFVAQSATSGDDERLDSWKQIAGYLDKSERTVRRWQQTEGLPVHRHLHQKRGSVWAYRHELDQWLALRRQSPEPLSEAAPSRSRLWPLLGAAAATLTAVAALWFFVHRPPPPLPAGRPLTALPGVAYGATFSPDGSQAAFFWTANSPGGGIFVKTLNSDVANSDTPRPLVTGGGFNYSPAWSPDGQTLAFIRRTPENETWLGLISPAGGPERMLLRLNPRQSFSANNQHLTWSRDSRWLLAPMRTGPKPASIVRVAVDGTVEPFTAATGNVFGPALSPDGTSFVYLRTGGSATGTFEILRQGITPDGHQQGTSEVIYSGQGRSSGLAWFPGGKDLILCTEGLTPADRQETHLYRLSARPGSQPILVSPDACSSLTVSSPNSNGESALLYGKVQHRRTTLYHAPPTALGSAAEFAVSSRSDTLPQFSPDGKTLSFVSNRTGSFELWLADFPSGTTRRITTEGQVRSPVRWSPDATRLLFGTAATHPPGLATIQLPGNAVQNLLLGGRTAQDPAWSHDGKSLYYSSDGELWHSAADGSDRRSLVSRGGFVPVGESADGKWFYYARISKGIILARVPVPGGPEEILDREVGFRWVAMSHRFLYYIRADNAVVRLPLAGGQTHPLGFLPGLEPGRKANIVGLAVKPDDTECRRKMIMS